MKKAQAILRISVVAVSASIYFFFYLIVSPGALDSAPTELVKAIQGNDLVGAAVSINEKSIRAKSGRGQTPLSIAIRQGDVRLVESLLSHGADPNGRSDDRDQPEIVESALGACHVSGRTRTNALEILNLLVSHGANVNLRDTHGDTALLRAATCGANDVAKILIAAGANPNAVSDSGAVPLHQAIFAYQRNRDIGVVRTLIGAGANPFVRNSEKLHGTAAIDLANEYQDSELLDLLMTGSDKAPLVQYLDERKNSSYEARRLGSLLSELGVAVPSRAIFWITNNKLFVLVLPALLCALVGAAGRDKRLLCAGIAQPVIVSAGFFLMIVLSAARGS